MKRIGRTLRYGRGVKACEVGVVLDGYPAPVIELTVRQDGRWELVEREYGISSGTVLAEGRVKVAT